MSSSTRKHKLIVEEKGGTHHFLSVVPGLLPDIKALVEDYCLCLDLLEWQEMNAISNRARQALRRILGPVLYGKFIKCMERVDAIISGSFLLHIILDDPLDPNKMDIDCFMRFPPRNEKSGRSTERFSLLHNLMWKAINRDEKLFRALSYPDETREDPINHSFCDTYQLPNGGWKVQVVVLSTEPRQHVQEKFDFDCIRMWWEAVSSEVEKTSLKETVAGVGSSIYVSKEAHEAIKSKTIERKPGTNYKFQEAMCFRVAKYHKKGFVNIGPYLTSLLTRYPIQVSSEETIEPEMSYLREHNLIRIRRGYYIIDEDDLV